MSTDTMTGLELLRAGAAGKLPHASISDIMGMYSMEVEEGRVVIHARADERHLNPLGGVHGGFAATVLIPSRAARCIPPAGWRRLRYRRSQCEDAAPRAA